LRITSHSVKFNVVRSKVLILRREDTQKAESAWRVLAKNERS
jgi:hypothetical protein